MFDYTRCYPKVSEMYQKKSRHTQSPNRHRPLQSSPLGSVHNDPNDSATTGSYPGSSFMSASSVPSAIRPGSPLRCQIFALSTWFLSWERGRSHKGLNEASRRWGTTVMFLEAKKCCTAKAVCAGAFSWRSTQLFVRHLPGHFRLMSSLSRLRISQYNFALTVWSGGTNSWWIIPSISQKQITTDVTLLFTCRTFFGRSEDGHFHWDDCCFVSGSYP
jgi:hypothetical protein